MHIDPEVSALEILPVEMLAVDGTARERDACSHSHLRTLPALAALPALSPLRALKTLPALIPLWALRTLHALRACPARRAWVTNVTLIALPALTPGITHNTLRAL